MRTYGFDEIPCLVHCYACTGLGGDKFEIWFDEGPKSYVWNRHYARYLGRGWVLTTVSYAGKFPCEPVPLETKGENQ